MGWEALLLQAATTASPSHLSFISASLPLMRGSGLGGPVRVSESLSCSGRAQVLTFGGSLCLPRSWHESSQGAVL